MPNGDQNQADDFLDKFQVLPEVAQGYFLDEKTADRMIKLGKDFKLSNEQKSALVDLGGEISVKNITIADILTEVEKELGLSLEESKKLTLALLGNYFLPLNDFYDGAVEKTIKALGGKIKDYPELRVMVKKESAGSAAEEVAKEFLPLFPDEVLRHRFLDTVDSRLRDVRKESDLREMLIRSAKVGGLGLDEETAGRVIEATAEKMRSVKIISDTEAAAVKDAGRGEVSSPKKEVVPLVDPASAVAEEALPQVKIKKDAEVKKLEEISPPRRQATDSGGAPPRRWEEKLPELSKPPVKIINPLPVKKQQSPPLNLRGAGGVKKDEDNPLNPPYVKGEDKIETVNPAPSAPPSPSPVMPKKPASQEPPPKPSSTVIPADAGIQKKELSAVPNLRESANIRAIQDAKETPSLEPRKIKKDISDAELSREIQHIKHDQMTRVKIAPVNFEEIATGIVKQSQLKLNPEQIARLKTTLTARLKDIRDGQETKDILSRDYALGGMSFSETQVNVIMPILEKEFEKISERLHAEAEEKISAERRFEEERRRGAAETSRLAEEQSREKRFAELVGEKSKKTAPAAPKPPPGIPSVPSPAQTGKPKIQDIKYEPKLVGPVDEIGSLTLVDFRRLGTTAKDATLKIKEKVESLKADSIKKWQEGIGAWNGGEINKLYLQLFGEALQKRKSLKDVSAEREAAKQPFLSPDEINAIMELNRSLRF